MSVRWLRRPRDERGAIAVLTVAMLALLLMLGAVGIDLGNAMNRKGQTQTSADFASLAGANGLPSTATPTVQMVADYLNKNQPTSDGTQDCNADAGSTITTTMLTDGNIYNGEVTFPSSERIKVVAPAARVQFGLANLFGHDDGCVNATSLARISSGAIGMMPYYVTTACDSGPQVIKSDAGGPSIPFTVPTLFADGQTNNSVLGSVDPNPNPNLIALEAVGAPDGPTITLYGTNLTAANIDKVGFFSTDQTAPKTATPVTYSGTSLTVKVPNAVASYQDVWWIRVHRISTDTWSARSEARALQVGDALLSCDPESSSGNFGSINFPWGGNDLEDLEKSIMFGPQKPETLDSWSGTLPADNDCQNMLSAGGTISTEGNLNPETNCVQSVTGLKAQPAYDGYLKSPDGRLLVDTDADCQSRGRPVRGPYNENSDVLSCFLINDTLKLSDTITVAPNDAKFTQAIYDSPRFAIVPILAHDPNGTKWMPIVTFVGAFVTDQPTGASRTNPLVTGATDNGLVIQNPAKLRAIRMFFFDLDALPPPPDGGDLTDYLGVGPKKIQLIN